MKFEKIILTIGIIGLFISVSTWTYGYFQKSNWMMELGQLLFLGVLLILFIPLILLFLFSSVNLIWEKVKKVLEKFQK